MGFELGSKVMLCLLWQAPPFTVLDSVYSYLTGPFAYAVDDSSARDCYFKLPFMALIGLHETCHYDIN